jgi:hypothetical protein
MNLRTFCYQDAPAAYKAEEGRFVPIGGSSASERSEVK